MDYIVEPREAINKSQSPITGRPRSESAWHGDTYVRVQYLWPYRKSRGGRTKMGCWTSVG